MKQKDDAIPPGRGLPMGAKDRISGYPLG